MISWSTFWLKEETLIYPILSSSLDFTAFSSIIALVISISRLSTSFLETRNLIFDPTFPRIIETASDNVIPRTGSSSKWVIISPDLTPALSAGVSSIGDITFTKPFSRVTSITKPPNSPLDFHYRIEALNEFTKSANSKSLIEANKRIANILKDSNEQLEKLNPDILVEDSEKILYKATESLSNELSGSKNYKEIMKSLLNLKETIDSFFDNVMVNTEDEKVKSSRLALIRRVRHLYLSVADISHLSS